MRWWPPSLTAQTENFSAGAFPARWADRPPPDPARLARWLRQGDPDADLAAAVADLLRERVLTPPERVALLRLLARLPGLSYRGLITARVDGMRGEAFSVVSASSGLPTQHTFLINPLTGGVLATERMLTQRAGQLNVRIPAVVGYDVYLAADRVAEIGARGEPD